MKHDFNITIILITIFFLSQIAGLFIVQEYVQTEVLVNQSTGEKTTQVTYNDIEVVNTKVEHPDVDESFSFIYIGVVIIIATLLILLLVKFKKAKLWKMWFSLSIFLASYIALEPFIKKLIDLIPLNNARLALKISTLAIVLFLVFMKVYKKNMIVHNITEIIMYGGIASIFVPVMNIFSASMLLIFISLYDMYAVWKSKHMVAMANFQTESNVFAGLYLLYDKKSKKIILPPKNKANQTAKESKKEVKKDNSNKKHSVKQAILGGGDIAFPLIFASTILKATASIYFSVIIVIFSTIAISLLFFLSKPGKFYPAMPFISAGCFSGYLVVFLIQFIL